MGKAIRTRLIGRPDEWSALDEPARNAYRLAALDVCKKRRQQMTMRGACEMIADLLGHEFIGPDGLRYETTAARNEPITF